MSAFIYFLAQTLQRSILKYSVLFWGHGNKRKRHKLEAVTERAKAIIRCQHYYVYSAYENLCSTEMFYSRGV